MPVISDSGDLADGLPESKEDGDDRNQQVGEDQNSTERENMTEQKANAINGDLELQENGDQQKCKRVSRKRSRNPKEWASNIRKEKFDRGLEYVSSRKKVRTARKIVTKKDCIEKCIYKCSRKISDEDRKQIFSDYYKLDAKEKRMFILSTTEKCNPERRRKGKNAENSKKANTFRYFFNLNNNRIQVCKLFYCGTLGISQKPIYTVHKHATESHTLRQSTQGKHKKKYTSEEAANLVRLHINMFPRVESHYCRSNSKRQYLEGDLSIQKMYNLYLDFAEEKGVDPVKVHIYRKIFCTEFNYSFNKPAKDICDLCAEVDLKKKRKKPKRRETE